MPGSGTVEWILVQHPHEGQMMSRSLIVLSLFIVVALVTPTEEAERGESSGLSITIVTGKDESGTSTIDYNSNFQVLLTNRSKDTIHLWSERCQLGYSTLSFQVENGGGLLTIMRKRTPDLSAWKDEPPRTITVAAGESYRWYVAPRARLGEPEWIAPEPNTGMPLTLTAIFEIKSTAQAKQQGVWTGRITSKPVKAMVVDAKLHTPHDYLRAGFPERAIKIMQADRTWIGKQDDMQQTPLHVAADYGCVEVVRWLLSHGADVNARCYNEFTPLHLAKDPEVVKLLVGHTADINASINGMPGTALQEAATDFAHFAQHPEFGPDCDRARAITKILLDAGADYDIISACCLGNLERVRTLTADKWRARDPEAIEMAARYGRTAIVKLLLERGAAQQAEEYGGLPLSYFAVEHAETLKVLLDAGADPKARVDYHGNGGGPRGSTLIHEAAGKGVVESVKLLVARGVSIDARDSKGATPLDAACFGGHTEIVDWLLRNKANVNAHADKGRTPMSEAARQVRSNQDEETGRYQAIIRLLERAGVELDVFAAIACNDVRQVARILQANPKAVWQRDRDGLPSLHRAVILDRREIVNLLLDKGCDPNIVSKSESVGCGGETALFEAAFWGRLEIAEVLIRRGANVNARAERGITPLHDVAYTKEVELARLLLEHGADVNARDNKQRTPLDWSSDPDGSPEMADVLRRHREVK